MELEFHRLTSLQNKVGYVEGPLNVVALAGLAGETGEVLNEVKFVSQTKKPEKIKKLFVLAAENMDDFKKLVRKQIYPDAVTIAVENQDALDEEIADMLYYLNAVAINRGKNLGHYAKMAYDKVIRKSQVDISHGSANAETAPDPGRSIGNLEININIQANKIMENRQVDTVITGKADGDPIFSEPKTFKLEPGMEFEEIMGYCAQTIETKLKAYGENVGS